MGWPTSRLVVFPESRGFGLHFRCVSILVCGQVCIRDRDAHGGRMVLPGGEFTVKPERADIRRIPIAHAMRNESVVRNGYKVFRGCATGSAKGEGVFTDRSPVFKPDIL